MTKFSLILVDGSSWLFRAFHALPPLTTSKGQPVGAIYGVVNMLRRMMKDYPNIPLWVVFDAKGKNFRHEWYADYKAHRPPMPVELSAQYEPLIALIRAMGLPLLSIPGVEADDVIATLTHEANQRGESVLISTSDKDMAQLVSPEVTLVNTMTGQVLDEAGVLAKFGVLPDRIVDYLALIGDTADNIPGVSGCGPKTAVKWLNLYGSLEGVIAHANEISGKIGQALSQSLVHLPLAKQLVSLKKDVPLAAAHQALSDVKPNPEEFLALAEALEFKTILKELRKTDASEGYFRQYVLVNTEALFLELEQALLGVDFFCLDTETTNLDPLLAELVGISFAISGRLAWYLPLMHTDGTQQLQAAWVLSRLKPLLEREDLKKVGQNLKYDYHVFKNYDITLRGIQFDTMLESYLLNSAGSRHDLDSLALKYLDVQTIPYEAVAGKGKKSRRFDEVPVSEAAPYAAEDAAVTLALHLHLYPLLPTPLKTLLSELEVPLIAVLADLERVGVLIDFDALARQGERLKQKLAILEQEAMTLAGVTFNLNSPKQLQVVLYETLALPILSKTPTGQASTSEETLEALAMEYRLPRIILEYRRLGKLVSTYIDALPKRKNSKTGRVHTSYNQAVTVTGRLSSSDPNLQNIPIRTEDGREIRRAFVAGNGNVLLALDYSQIELRIMAHLSQDEHLLSAFQRGEDIHRTTAARMFHIAETAVTQEERRRAKAVNFGLLYGMSAFGLSKQLGVSREEAERYMTRYFQEYPGVKAYMESIKGLAKEQGYVETLFGRRLYLPEIRAQNMVRRKAAERMAINAPMQGTAADIIKRAMIAIHAWQQTQIQYGVRMMLQVHDELVFEVPEKFVHSVKEPLQYLMENTTTLSVPLAVAVGVGPNWDAAH